MSNKQGYNTTEIGKVPEDWDIVKLGDVCEVYDNKRIPLSEEQRKDIKGTYPYCGANGIIDYINKYIFDGEYVLLAEDGGYWGSFQQSAYLMSGKFWVNNHAHILKAIEGKAVNKFLAEVLNFLDLTPFITGSTRGKLNQLRMRFIIAPLPPFEEQKRIALIFSCVDEAIQKTAEIIQKAQELKKGLTQQLLTKGIGHTKFKQTEIGEIPEEWEVTKVGEICKSIVPGRNKPKKFDGDIPWITLPDIEGMYIESSKLDLKVSKGEVKKCGGKIVPPNSVIMTCIGEFGIVAITTRDLVINQQLHAFICPPNLEPYFLAMALMSQAKYMRSIATTTVVPYLNKDNCNSIPIPVPSISEQKKIASILSVIDEKIEKEKQGKEQLEKLKKGLMQDLLTGKVRVKVN